jgi:hypothetical protein
LIYRTIFEAPRLTLGPDGPKRSAAKERGMPIGCGSCEWRFQILKFCHDHRIERFRLCSDLVRPGNLSFTATAVEINPQSIAGLDEFADLPLSLERLRKL